MYGSENDEPAAQNDSSENESLLSDEEVEIPEESKISKILSDKTTRTVVILVLTMLFSTQLCQPDNFLETVYVHTQALKHLVQIYDLGDEYNEDYVKSLEHFKNETRKDDAELYPLVFLQFGDPNSTFSMAMIKDQEWEPRLVDLRIDEYNSITIKAENGVDFIAAYSMKTSSQLEAIINISRTTFICLVLSFASIFFTKDAQTLVLDPLERMIEKVKLMAQNPLAAATDEVENAGVYTYAIKTENKDEKTVEEEKQYETAVLERAIVKIGHLLALGLGEAGGMIIAQNISSGGDLDPMIPGTKTYCIFGFCIIDDFVETTEALETEIMMYVNKIAEIVHSCVDKYRGAPNKNIGEAFLCVWKFYDPDEIEQMDMLGKYSNKRMCKENRIVADLSVYAFLKVIAKINKYEHILEYNQMESIKKTVSDDFRVRMGFGLHQGWAIEGSIGSYFKIDASYLSPNVNMAARLEAATKQFGTEVLLSGDMHDILSDELKQVCREIDTVTVKGSIRPVRLFTVDINIRELVPSQDPMFHKGLREKKYLRYKLRKMLFQSLYSGKTSTAREFNTDHELIELRRFHDPEFEARFALSYQLYLAGDWETAGEGFEELLAERPDDGPTRSLHNVINIQHKGVCPPDWKGFRPLTSK
uniref:Guanylate cyclase domain-containing protein n=1 Tax=Strombidium rassoulzadegani TaxID=1082188 RepID=A0A7S3CQ90_9SPIT|mmetsp:Transcript_359/g.654  ORF Transcript_359/g.654 Transcript_359/m.654 type:complete len:646 (+) Transcript_359:340-2277(+)